MKSIIDLHPFYNKYIFDVLGSTNEHAMRYVSDGYPEGTLILAYRQTHGRGRQGKTWDSPKNNLYFSIILRPNLCLRRCSQLSFIAALSVRKSIKSLINSKYNILLKWPNDILVDQKKISGILLETSSVNQLNLVESLVLGIGVNVNNKSNLFANSTSISLYRGKTNIYEVLNLICNYFYEIYKDWKLNNNFERILNEWLQFSYPIGTLLEVNKGGVNLKCKFNGLDSNGSLILLTNNKKEIITGGDVNIISLNKN